MVAFQPHLVSRTRTFGPAMGRALGAADEVVVCDVYLAREDADSEVTGALVANAFAAEERGRAMGIYAGVSMVFLALGPLIGGLLCDLVSWRAVFFVNLPVGIALWLAARVTLPRSQPQPGRVDWGGVPLIVLSLTCLVLGLMQ